MYMIDVLVRALNSKPICFTASTNAPSSGLAAWYTILPSGIISGITVWHATRILRKSSTGSLSPLALPLMREVIDIHSAPSVAAGSSSSEPASW